MMPGMIMLWAGAIVDIPSGWHLCDGTMGTPDLLDRFVVCAGDAYTVDERGGADEHHHEWSTGYFYMSLVAGPHIAAGSDYDEDTDYMLITDDTTSDPHIPLYHALCYIMKLN